MKICPKCRKTYPDGYSYCNECGSQTMCVKDRKTYYAVGFVSFIAIIVIALAIGENIKISRTKHAIEDSRYHKAVEESRNTPQTSDLRINEGWTTETSGNYIYIKGSVTNISSSKTISYFEIEAKFYNNDGEVIDSDWTNDGKDLAPRETRQFEIMHKKNKEQKKVGLYVKDIR